MSLTQYLAQLDSVESQWGIWVNPQNLEEYRIGQFLFENGGVIDNFVSIGSMESFTEEKYNYCGSFYDYVHKHHSSNILFNGKQVRFNSKSMADAISSGLVDKDFEEALYEEYNKMCQDWSEEWASSKVEELETYFAPGGEWEQEFHNLEREAEAWLSYKVAN